MFVWAGFDYGGEPSPLGWPDINSHFGILDRCGFPKDAFSVLPAGSSFKIGLSRDQKEMAVQLIP